MINMPMNGQSKLKCSFCGIIERGLAGPQNVAQPSFSLIDPARRSPAFSIVPLTESLEQATQDDEVLKSQHLLHERPRGVCL